MSTDSPGIGASSQVADGETSSWPPPDDRASAANAHERAAGSIQFDFGTTERQEETAQSAANPSFDPAGGTPAPQPHPQPAEPTAVIPPASHSTALPDEQSATEDVEIDPTATPPASGRDPSSPSPKQPRDRRKPPPRRQRKARRVHRVVHHFDIWSVAKVSGAFAACGYLVTMISGYLLWQVADRVGTIEGVEGFMEDTGGYETFIIEGAVIFRVAAFVGVVAAILVVCLAILGAILFNLISDLTGGVRMTVIDEDLIVTPARREQRPRGS